MLFLFTVDLGLGIIEAMTGSGFMFVIKPHDLMMLRKGGGVALM